MALSRHHILHEASAWNSRREGAILRSEPSLVPKIERSDHDEIHRQCPHVPLLGSYALRSVASEFQPGRDTFESIDHLLIAIEAASRHPKAHLIERQLAELSIHAIESQVPLLQESVGKPKERTVFDLKPSRHLYIVR